MFKYSTKRKPDATSYVMLIIFFIAIGACWLDELSRLFLSSIHDFPSQLVGIQVSNLCIHTWKYVFNELPILMCPVFGYYLILQE